jgi:aspartate aminotransferase
MTGWRIGFAGAPRDLIRAMDTLQGQSTSGTSSISQAAALAALTGPQDSVERMRVAYQARRDLVVRALNEIPGMDCHCPEVAFYVYPHVAAFLGKTTPGGTKLMSDTDFAMALLNEAQVATVQGAAFSMSPHIRISTATDVSLLRRACERIADFCAKLR